MSCQTNTFNGTIISGNNNNAIFAGNNATIFITNSSPNSQSISGAGVINASVSSGQETITFINDTTSSIDEADSSFIPCTDSTTCNGSTYNFGDSIPVTKASDGKYYINVDIYGISDCYSITDNNGNSYDFSIKNGVFNKIISLPSPGEYHISRPGCNN